MTIILKINNIYIYIYVKIPHIISEILTISIDYFLSFVMIYTTVKTIICY